jgi:sugar lactone lactonase YvrE
VTTTERPLAPPAACEPFEPYEIDVQAEPNGLYWRGDLATLFIADDDNNRILTRAADGAGGVFAEIPSPSNDPGSDGLGQLAAAADGALFVPRFGFDDPTLGGVFRVAPDGRRRRSPGSPPTSAASASTTTTTLACSTSRPTTRTRRACSSAGSPRSTR